MMRQTKNRFPMKETGCEKFARDSDLLERNIVVVEVVFFAEIGRRWFSAGGFRGECWFAARRRLGETRFGGVFTGVGGLDFPAGKIHEIFSVELVSADVEADLDVLLRLEIIEKRAFILHDFEFEILRIFVVEGRYDKFAFGETAGERLDFVDQFDFSCDLVHGLNVSFQTEMSTLGAILRLR